MTDGIIQQAFSKYAQLVEYSNETTDNPIIQKMLEQLQQELIEKIKQLEFSGVNSIEDFAINELIEKLIGDNQE